MPATLGESATGLTPTDGKYWLTCVETRAGEGGGFPAELATATAELYQGFARDRGIAPAEAEARYTIERRDFRSPFHEATRLALLVLQPRAPQE